MEITAVEVLKDVLRAAKNQFVSISVANQAGKWSEEYFTVGQLVSLETGHESMTLVILNSLNNSRCEAVDVKLLFGIKFNKYLNLNGELIEELKIRFADDLQLLY